MDQCSCPVCGRLMGDKRHSRCAALLAAECTSINRRAVSASSSVEATALASSTLTLPRGVWGLCP